MKKNLRKYKRILLLSVIALVIPIILRKLLCKPAGALEQNFASDMLESGADDSYIEESNIEEINNKIIYQKEIDLTNDDVAENLTSQLYSITDDLHERQYSDELVSSGRYGIEVTIKDGISQDIIYDRKFSIDRIGQGQLALVTDGQNWYLLENDCNEQMGYGSYYGEVFDWVAGEKKSVDEFHADFVIDEYAALRCVQNGEEIISRDDVIQQYQDKVKKWYEGSELIVACDTGAYNYNESNTYVTTANRRSPLSLKDYFENIWKRYSSHYEAQTFENIMGMDGFIIKEELINLTVYNYFEQENGKRIADSTGDDYLVDINQDGVNELICNICYGDGGQNTEIYYLDKRNHVKYGYADGLLDEEYDYQGVGSEYSKYIPEENIVEIFYWLKEEQVFKSKKYKIDMDKIEFYDYG